MPRPTLVLKTKLLPPAVDEGWLDRPRLFERLEAGLDRGATLLLAGPGYGKSTLTTAFLSRRTEPRVWLRLDESDDEPWMVLRYLIEGLRQHAPDFGRDSEDLWNSLREGDEPVDRLTDVFIRDAEESLTERTIVVLDGVEHLTAAPGTRAMLARLQEYLPGTLHLMLVGRLSATGQLKAAPHQAHRIAPDELRFGEAETRELIVERWGHALDDGAIQRIHTRTRGWITGLQLLVRAAVTSQDDPLPADIFDRNELDVFEYFSESVLGSVDPETQELLLAAAVPKAFSAGLIGEVLEVERAASILDTLVRQRLFISRLGGDRDVFEFDPLFRDFLLKKLRTTRPAEVVAGLHRRFGEVLDSRGDTAGALQHLIESGDPAAITRCLVRTGKRALSLGFLTPVERAAEAVLAGGAPDSRVTGLLGEVARTRGDFARAVGHFEAALRPDATPVLAGADRAGALQGLAHSRLKLGAVAVAEATAREALDVSGDDDALTARILNSLAVALYRSGRLDDAIQSWQDALARARRGGEAGLTLMIAHNLGLPHAMLGNFDRAAECFRMLTDPGLGHLGPETGAALLNLARIATLRAEYASAARLLDDAWELSSRWGLRALSADVLEAQGTLLRESGKLAEAGQKYTEARSLFTELGLVALADNLEEEEALLAARLGHHARAERIASDLLARAATAGDQESMASAKLALGEIRAAGENPAAATDVLTAARDHYRGRRQSYQHCVAELWSALAALRCGDGDEAGRAAGDAMRLASQYRYDGVVLRLARPHPALRELLARQPGCSEALRADLGEGQPEHAAALGAVSPSGLDLRICLLGPVEVYRDEDRRIPDSAWKLKRALKTFCYLAAARGHRAPKERIVEAIWHDATRDAVEKNFHPTISFLRKALNHAHSAGKNFILYEAGAYRFNPSYRYSVDTLEFESAVKQARDAADSDRKGALGHYDAALALHRGDFLDELFDEWAEADRRHYAILYRQALREAGEMHLAAGNLELCVDYLRRLAEHDRTDEHVSSHLMMALGALGRRPDVEREFERLTDALRRELATAPRAATRKAYLHAMAGDPD